MEVPMRRCPLLLLICALAAPGVAACGGDGGSTTTTGTTHTTATEGVIKVEADPNGALAFVQKSLTAKPGRNRIVLTNKSSVPHDVKIEKDGREIGGTEVVINGTADATVDLNPGRYTFFCSVPGHRQAGMEGPLTVR
jgi:plastocyanin